MLAFLLTVATGVVTTVCAPGWRAAAAADTITIVSAGSPASSVGDLSVVADSAVEATAMSAELWRSDSSGTSTEALVVPLTRTGSKALADGETESTWRVATPITESQLALGEYSITVDVTFADNSTTSLQGVGTLNFLDQLSFTLSANHTVVSWDNMDATVSGRVISRDPEGQTAPYANETVLLTGLNEYAKTDANGDFGATFRPTSEVTVSAAADDSGTITAAGQSTTITFTVHRDTVKLTVKLSATRINYGTKLTAAGYVSYDPAGTFVPFASQTVFIAVKTPYWAMLQLTTDATGHFTTVLPVSSVSTTYEFNAGGYNASDPYLKPMTVDVPVTVYLPVTVTGFKISLNRHWQLSYSGCVTLSKDMPDYAGGVHPRSVTIEDAPSPTGPWSALRVAQPPAAGSCGIQGWPFEATGVPTRFSHAYYRVYFAGTRPAYEQTTYKPFWTKPALVWMYADRIANFSVSTWNVIRATGKNTIKGQLLYSSGASGSTWHDYGGQVVTIVFRRPHSSVWRRIATVRTNSTGHFSVTLKDSLGGVFWQAWYDGSSTHLGTRSSLKYI